MDLCPTDPGFRIVGADTKPINLEGHATVNFRRQNSKFSWDMHVADIREDGIIGLDFLIEHNYTLGAKTGLRLNRKRYPCVLEKTLYNSNVVCLDTKNIIIIIIIPNLYSTFIICAYVQKCFTQNTLKHTQIH